MSNNLNLDERSIYTIRFLSADGVQAANSGHPGLPMGAAAIAYVIWVKHLKHNPANPKWFDRDRFVLSGGHGSMLLYSLLHLSGYDVSIEDLKNFRQWNSITPGHPEFGLTPGVETTTGPLGQGFANGVGMAIVEEHLRAIFNKPDFPLIDHYTYGIVTDGDLMEGVSSEAASLAGHLQLGKLIYFYDDNRITIDGSTELSFTEDRAKRFEAYCWHIVHVENGNSVKEIDQAVNAAKLDPRPSLVICRTHIGFGLPTKQDTSDAHGSPPGEEELSRAKQNVGWPIKPSFYISEVVGNHFKKAGELGKKVEDNWNQLFENYKSAYPALAAEFERRISGKLPDNWDADEPIFEPDPKGLATRKASGIALNWLAAKIPDIIGGSADLTPSNNTWIEGDKNFQSNQRDGRYLRFGVRENAMGSIVNGMAYHGGVIPFGATFLVFSDYMRPALRLSALSHLHSVWIFTHDSIGLGEDGPTHQPVEHLAALRAIPGMILLRPGDANEVTEAWKVAISTQNSPIAIALTRQTVPTLDRAVFGSAKNLTKGAYILKDFGENKPEIILMASGSEVQQIVNAAQALVEKGISSRVVSFPSWELFSKQDKEYQQSVLLPFVKLRLAVEAGVTQGWEKWVGSEGWVIGIDRYGASAPGEILMEKFGFTADHILDKALMLLNRR